VIKPIKKALPTIFYCPSCGNETVKIKVDIKKGKAQVKCDSCGMAQEISANPPNQLIDLYCRFMDNFYWKPGAPVQTEPVQTEPVQTEAIAEQKRDVGT
jgi:transcription elongation factor Elf1